MWYCFMRCTSFFFEKQKSNFFEFFFVIYLFPRISKVGIYLKRCMLEGLYSQIFKNISFERNLLIFENL